MQVETDIATYLNSQLSGFGAWTSASGAVLTTRSQDSPDAQVVVRAYGGRESDKVMGPADAIRYIRFQVECLALTAALSNSFMETIRDYFPRLLVTSSGPPTRSYFVKAISEPIQLGEDPKKRWRCACNFEAARMMN